MYKIGPLALIIFGLMHLFIKYGGDIVTCVMCGGILFTVIDVVAVVLGVIGLVGNFTPRAATTS